MMMPLSLLLLGLEMAWLSWIVRVEMVEAGDLRRNLLGVGIPTADRRGATEGPLGMAGDSA